MAQRKAPRVSRMAAQSGHIDPMRPSQQVWMKPKSGRGNEIMVHDVMNMGKVGDRHMILRWVLDSDGGAWQCHGRVWGGAVARTLSLDLLKAALRPDSYCMRCKDRSAFLGR